MYLHRYPERDELFIDWLTNRRQDYKYQQIAMGLIKANVYCILSSFLSIIRLLFIMITKYIYAFIFVKFKNIINREH